LIDKCLLSGGVTIVIDGPIKTNPPDTGQPSLATMQPYWQAERDIAILNDLSYIDLPQALGDWATQNALGNMYDVNHMTFQGYGAAGMGTPYLNYFLQVAAP